MWLIVATASFLLLLSTAWLGYYMQRTLLKLAQCVGVLGYDVQQSLVAYLTQLYVRLQSINKKAGGFWKLKKPLNLEEPFGDFWLMQLIWILCYTGASRLEERISLTGLDSSAGHSKRFGRKRKLRIGKNNHGMQVFSFESMVQATDNFSPSNEIGQGGYGMV